MADHVQASGGQGAGQTGAGDSLLSAPAGGGGAATGDPGGAQAGGAGSGGAEGGGAEGGGAAGRGAWYEGLPADLVTDKLRRYASLEEAVRGFANAQRALGKKGLEAPGENASPEEWAAYYAAVGRPETPEGYAWSAPEGVQLDEERFQGARAKLHAAGLRPEQFASVMSLYTEELAAQEQAATEAAKQELNESYEVLKQQWGEKTEERLQLLGAFARERGLLEVFNATGLGRNAAALQLLDEMRLSVREGEAAGQGGQAGTAADQIERLKGHPAYMDRRHPEHRRVLEDLEKAYRRAQR